VKRAIKYLLLSIVGAIVLAVGGVLFLCLKPEILLNERVLNFAQTYLGKQGIVLSWRTANLHIRSVSFFQKELTFSTEGFCAQIDPQLVCFERADIGIQFSFSHFIPRLVQVGPLAATGGKIRLDVTSEETNTAPKNENTSQFVLPRFQPPGWLASATLSSALIDAGAITIRSGEVEYAGKARVTANADGKASRWTFLVDAKSNDGLRADANGNLFSRDSYWAGPWSGDAKLKIDFDKNQRLEGTLALSQPTDERLEVRLNGTYDARPTIIHLNARGTVLPDHLQVAFSGDSTLPVRDLPSIRANECTLDYRVGRRDATRGNLKLQCPLAAQPRYPQKPRGIRGVLPASLNFLLESDLETPLIPAADDRIAGKVDLKITDVTVPGIAATGGVHVDADGILRDFPRKMKMNSELAVDIKATAYETFVRALAKHTRWAVPEPFNGMKGTIDVSVKGEGEVPWEIRVLPITLNTRLSSPTQKFDLDASAELKLNQTPAGMATDLLAEVVLSDVRLVLPYLNVNSPPPRILPDPRIASFTNRKPATSDRLFTYQIMIRSPKEKPLRFVSNLAQRDIPIDIDIFVDNKATNNISITVNPFPLQLFKRDAQVKKLALRSDPKEAEALYIDGEIQISYVDYTVFIRIGGTTDEPKISLSSEPPLTETQLYSVLLFGRPLDQLESGEIESVGNARSALASGAVSLASMYILASTPIESVGYDPGTGTMSAKVRLADGTSLNVGANMREVERVGIRKRLGPNWYIDTYIDSPLDSAHRTLNAFLEWNKIY